MILTHSSSLLQRQFRQSLGVRPLSSIFSYFSSTGSPTKDVISKRDIVEEIAEAHDLSFSKSERILNTVLDTIVEAVADDRLVRLSKFGSLQSYDSPARTGRNPATGQSMLIPAKKRIRFKPYTSFKKTANGEN